jgi:uncharacterized tellurite resistance protein B-like protein
MLGAMSTDQGGGHAGGPKGPDASARAIFEIVAMIAFVDGHLDLNEAAAVKALLANEPRFAGIGDGFAIGIEARRLVEEIGIDEAIERVTAPITTAEDRRLAFRLCARVMMADGKTDGDEAMVLGTLQERFGITHAEVVAILDAEKQPKTAT